MLRVRSKVASKISKIKEAEDFNFSNWLKKPVIHEHPVEAVVSYLKELPDLQIEFNSPDNSEFKFDIIDPDVTDELKNCDFVKVKSNAIFFMIALPTDDAVVYSDVEIKPVSFSTRMVDFLIVNPRIKTVKANIDSNPPVNYDCKLEVPAIFNYLSNLTAEIFKIELLEFEELASASKRVKVKDIEIEKFKKSKIAKMPLPGLPVMKKTFRIKVPSMGTYKFSEQKISILPFALPSVSDSTVTQIKKVKNYYANFIIPAKETIQYYRAVDRKHPVDPEKKTQKLSGSPQLQEQLSYILGNVRKVDWEKNIRLHIKLKKYEEAGAKYLAENEYAFLQEEIGIDTEKEAAAALKILFGNKLIKTALIITDFTKIGNPTFASHLNLEIGWSDKIKKHCPELSLNIIHGNNDERADLWNSSNSIILGDIDTTLNDYRLKILEESRLYKFDCIILDCVDRLMQEDTAAEFLYTIRPKVLWALTSVLDKNLPVELNDRLHPNVKIEKAFVRSKETLVQETPSFIINEFWCDADEKQTAEFKVALVDARKDLRRVLESGNPLRFTANIFTLFHRLNQLGNFAGGKGMSPKTDLLIKHLSNIRDNGKKALVLSQYEKLGIKKIAELLSNNGIKHIIAPNSLPAEEMTEVISKFQSNNELVAFVTDTKITKLKFVGADIPYIIKFDQWWNPISNWELEDIFIRSGDESLKESINIFHYYSTGTLDQKVRELLLENDLLNKNLLELMQPKLFEELISVDEWLNIFGMPVSAETKIVQTPEAVLEILRRMSMDDFRKLLMRLYSILGYSNLDILELSTSNSFNIIGRAQRNSRVFNLVVRVITESKISKSALENIVAESSSHRQDKVFVISKEILPVVDDKIIRENVTILAGPSLAKFLIRTGVIPNQV